MNNIKIIIDKLNNSNYCVAFTGAGISTESGIPDFRSKDGLYSKISPEVFDLQLFHSKPEVFYNFFKETLNKFVKYQPNITHKVLAELEKKGIIKSVITQNIDNLHQKAGSINVFEVHGSLQTAHCINCNKQFDYKYLENELLNNNKDIVLCDKCNSLVKPDIIFFGESLPEDFNLGLAEIQKSDLLLILGTSLQIYPAGSMPMYANGEIIVINKEPTPIDNKASIVIHDSLGNVFNQIAKELNL